MTTQTIHPDVQVPDEHLTYTFTATGGTHWLYGFRGHDKTARFTMIRDEDSTVILHNADWTVAWVALCQLVRRSTEDILRSVLPPWDGPIPSTTPGSIESAGALLAEAYHLVFDVKDACDPDGDTASARYLAYEACSKIAALMSELGLEAPARFDHQGRTT